MNSIAIGRVFHGVDRFIKRSAVLYVKQTPKCKANFSKSHTQNKQTVNGVTELKEKLKGGPPLSHFITNLPREQNSIVSEADSIEQPPYIQESDVAGQGRKVYIKTYGCQMNVNDTEIVWSILQKSGYLKTDDILQSDVILLMTCSIREGAETKIWNKLEYLKSLKRTREKITSKPSLKVGILGCMAERLKHKLIEKEKIVDLVAGPDSYKDLPRLLAVTQSGQTAVNVMLSLDETYADVMPVRLNENSPSAFVSIMRGCDNMCTYCIVPFTRGRERSRPIDSILDEVKYLSDKGIKEVTLLGQNVNSYLDKSEQSSYAFAMEKNETTHLSKGFTTVYRPKKGGLRFSDLLDKVSLVNPEMRIRFTSPHPKDFPNEVLHLIRERPNICKQIHLPAQCGSSRVLEVMKRGYTREAYLELVDHIRSLISDISLSSDFICGFCSETEEEFEETLSLMHSVKYNISYLFAYSMREKTRAFHRLKDDVPYEVKLDRLKRMSQVFRTEALAVNKQQIGKIQTVLIEGPSKRSPDDFAGRNDGNIKVIIPNIKIPAALESDEKLIFQMGDYVAVKITDATSLTLKGIPLYHTTLQEQTKQKMDVLSDNSCYNAKNFPLHSASYESGLSN